MGDVSKNVLNATILHALDVLPLVDMSVRMIVHPVGKKLVDKIMSIAMNAMSPFVIHVAEIVIHVQILSARGMLNNSQATFYVKIVLLKRHLIIQITNNHSIRTSLE